MLYSDDHPYIHLTGSFIYVLRNPKDVLLSNLNNFKLRGSVGVNDKEFVRDFIRHMGVRKRIEAGMGSWTENIRSWQSAEKYQACGCAMNNCMLTRMHASGKHCISWEAISTRAVLDVRCTCRHLRSLIKWRNRKSARIHLGSCSREPRKLPGKVSDS